MTSSAYTYQQSPLHGQIAVAAWQFQTTSACATRVFPDGCRDLIINEPSDSKASWFLSPLSDSAYLVRSAPRSLQAGMRLKPGTQVHSEQLQRWLQHHHPRELLVADQLDEFCTLPDNLAEALEVLARVGRSDKPGVSVATSTLGVSLRTLQRLLKQYTDRPPQYWVSLARARLAAQSLTTSISLAETAVVSGYADQAHMTRRLKQWFNMTPAQLRDDANALALLGEPGYANSAAPLSTH